MLRDQPTEIEPARFASNVRTLLDEDRRRYRLFGAHWYFVKALLKKFYDRHEMPILGDHEDATVIARMPAPADLQAALQAAVAEYQHNAAFNLGRNRVEDDDGETYWLLDPDVEG